MPCFRSWRHCDLWCALYLYGRQWRVSTNSGLSLITVVYQDALDRYEALILKMKEKEEAAGDDFMVIP